MNSKRNYRKSDFIKSEIRKKSEVTDPDKVMMSNSRNEIR